MITKYLCHDLNDFNKIGNRELSRYISGHQFPLIIKYYGNMKDVNIVELQEYVDDDGYPLLDVKDTQIVELKTKNDCISLYDSTHSWSSDTFQHWTDWLDRPFFVVSRGLRCRWYETLEDALSIVPFADVIAASDLKFCNENFSEMSLEKVLML